MPRAHRVVIRGKDFSVICQNFSARPIHGFSRASALTGAPSVNLRVNVACKVIIPATHYFFSVHGKCPGSHGLGPQGFGGPVVRGFMMQNTVEIFFNIHVVYDKELEFFCPYDVNNAAKRFFIKVNSRVFFGNNSYSVNFKFLDT